jgi:signal transduction histidine kinase
LLAEEQAALRRVATLVAQGISPDRLFSAVSDEVGRLFGAEAAIARFEADGSAMVVVGLTQGIPVLTIGTRWELEDFLASTEVYRTGKPARNDHTGHRDAPGEVAESLRQMDFVSTVAAPIVLDGSVWGVMTVSDRSKALPPDTDARVERFTELVAMAIANAESRAELAASEAHARELAREQAALQRVATLVAEGVSPEELFSAVSVEVGRLFGVEAVVARYEPDGSAIVVLGQTEGIPPATIGTPLELGKFLASHTVYHTGKPARSDHTQYRDASGPVAGLLRELGTVCTVGAPIIVERRLWGVMVLVSHTEPMPPDTERRVERFTELVATAIANAQSRAELAASEAHSRELAREQAALQRVATLVAKGAEPGELFAVVAQEVAEVLGIPVVGVQRFENDGTFAMMGIAGATEFTVGSRWPIESDGLAGTILRTGCPARKDDYATMPGALGAAVRHDGMVATVGVPIVVEGGIWGFMVGAAKPEMPIPPNVEGPLARFTELVATAIANGQARENLAQLADEQAALRRVATLVARGASPSEVFAVVSNELAGLFGSHATVARYEPDGSGIVTVGLTETNPGTPAIGERWPMSDVLASTTVFRTGRPARSDHFGHENAPGLSAEKHKRLQGLSTVATPIVVEGRLWGVLTISDECKPLPPEAEERSEKFTALVATAIANADSREELAASRARLVAAGDEARRRIERDLHDGAQQRLVTLAVALRGTEARIPAELDALRTEVTRVAEGLTTAVDELRDLSRGIHPSILTEAGLSPALKALGRRSAVRVHLEVGFEHRLPDHVEVAAYYTVSEALTNASKHANASRIWVAVSLEDEMLLLSIRDDGAGGADARRGSGLTGLTDRIEALGGKVWIESPRGSGTSIEVQIPTRRSYDR